MTLRSSVLFLALLMSVPSMAAPVIEAQLTIEDLDQIEPVDPVQQTINQLVELSGITGLSIQARNIAQKALNELNASVGQQYDVVDRVSAKWSPTYLQSQLQGQLQKYSPEAQQLLLLSLTDVSVQRAREKELAAVQEQGTEVYREYMQRLRLQPPSQDRVRRIQELDSAMQFSVFMSKTREHVYPQIRAVMSGFKAPEGWETKLRSDVLEFLLFVHRSTPNDELQRIINAYKEPQMQKWLKEIAAQLGT